MRDADERRNASIITHSSTRWRSTSAQVGCTTKTSVPRMFSSIWNETSVSGNRCNRACPTWTPRNSAISSVSARWALPEKILSCPLAAVGGSAPVVITQTPLLAWSRAALRRRSEQPRAWSKGWGGWIRTTEYGIQSPAPYRLATPQEHLEIWKSDSWEIERLPNYPITKFPHSPNIWNLE